MNQFVTVALVGGESGALVNELALCWQGERRPDRVDPACWTWPATIQRSVRTFVKSLHTYAARPPVLFYRRHVDQWSGGNVFNVFPKSHAASQTAVEIQFEDGEMYAYALPDRGTLARQLRQAARRSKSSVGKIEASWLVNAVSDAISATNIWKCRATLILIREIVGGTVEDNEIAASMEQRVEWLKALFGG